MKIKYFSLIGILMMLVSVTACKKYLDIVPDDVATIDNAFTRRSEAEKFLYTCYSYIPEDGYIYGNPAFSAGDEISLIWPTGGAIHPVAYNIARGNQNVVDPYGNFWDGLQEGKPLFVALRDCNIFLDNIGSVPDMETAEKNRWSAEVKFLKAYYIFYLVRMYGPIPLPKKNLEIGADVEAVRVYRDPVDSCFSYIVKLIDEATPDLPDEISDKGSELGRITKDIALTEKAKILVTAASPLFNGNPDYRNFVDNKGTHLFNPTFELSKWEMAEEACRKAIDFCWSVGKKLYYFQPDVSTNNLSPITMTKMNIRNAMAEKWNSGIIWANTNSPVNSLQAQCIPRGLDPDRADNGSPQGQLAPTLKIVEEFYTKNGLPITEDKTWDYANRYGLRTASSDEQHNILQGYTTAELNFDREPRFYADLGFDGGIWYGQGKYSDDDNFVVKAKKGQLASEQVRHTYSTTGYWIKKVVHYQDIIRVGSGLTIQIYPWPELRLADLYLLYAEALNESKGPSSEVYNYLDSIRIRAGIPTVEKSWTLYSKDPSKYTTQEGLRDIIQHERLIELAFEGNRYWDILRWKKAMKVFNEPIEGWDISQSDAKAYYRPRLIYNQVFSLKDYFWPIRDHNITVTRNLVQNPAW